jgi:hypothetical protein
MMHYNKKANTAATTPIRLFIGLRAPALSVAELIGAVLEGEELPDPDPVDEFEEPVACPPTAVNEELAEVTRPEAAGFESDGELETSLVDSEASAIV